MFHLQIAYLLNLLLHQNVLPVCLLPRQTRIFSTLHTFFFSALSITTTINNRKTGYWPGNSRPVKPDFPYMDTNIKQSFHESPHFSARSFSYWQLARCCCFFFCFTRTFILVWKLNTLHFNTVGV